MIQQYQLKTNPITLFLYTGDNRPELETWAEITFLDKESYSNAPENSLLVPGPREYTLTLSPGCWLEKLGSGKFEIYHASKLEEYYQPVPV